MRYYSATEVDPATSSTSKYPTYEQHPASSQPYPQPNAYRDAIDYTYGMPAPDRTYPPGMSDPTRPIQEYRAEPQDSTAPSQSQSYPNRGVNSRFDGEWTPYNGPTYQQNTYLQNSPTNVVPVRGQGAQWVADSRHRSPENTTTHPI